MAVTIKDIAKKVGVNPSTVSRVINGNASISEETKRKILKAMEELDYHPNIMGRSLVNGSTFTIGLVINAENQDAFSNTYFIQSVTAIEIAAEKQGYNVLITSGAQRNDKNMVKDLVLGHKVDGIILPAASITDDLTDLLTSNHFPFIVMGEFENPTPDTLWVDMDNEQGGRLAVRHLVERGYSHPVMFVCERKNVFEQRRIQGFKKEMAKQHISSDQTDIIECGSDKSSALSSIHALMNSEKSWDSIICTNNFVAYHVLCELKKRNKRLPDDVGIITFDNYPLAEYMDPPLTVVDVDTYKLGEQAALMLFEKIKNKKSSYKNTLIPTRIIPRMST